jgi:hypothetical protein
MLPLGIHWPRIMGPAGQMPLFVCWGRASGRGDTTIIGPAGLVAFV